MIETIILIPILFFILILVWARTSSPPETLGVTAGRLAPCPETSNCVSTQESDPEHAMPPIPISGDPQEARRRVIEIVGSMKRARIVREEATYIAAEFRTVLFGFVDDVEFLIGDGVIHFRSASRRGSSDFGVNRTRMQFISSAMGAGERSA